MKKIFTLLLLASSLLTGVHVAYAQEVDPQKTVQVFFNEACQDCGELVTQTYPKLFGEYGYVLDTFDYINVRSNRKLLTRINDEWGVPFELQSHIEAFVGDRLLIGGHVPPQMIRYLLEHPNAYERLLVYQDNMHGEETAYRVWDFSSEIQTYPIDEPITTYLQERQSAPLETKSDKRFLGFFALITSSAFLDGLNPCAFAVLLFFISFLFTLKKTRTKIWHMGLVYIGAIFLAYLFIGIGIAQAFIISGAPHFMAKIGAYLVISLGIIQLLGVVFPAFPIKLRIPLDTKATLEKWMYQATLPASFIGGFLVGLCTFPCSGGIYVAIIGMLAAQHTVVQGTLWMLWYNLIFVSPLIILLVLAANTKTTQKLQTWEHSTALNIKIAIGTFMIALGAIILLFFT